MAFFNWVAPVFRRFANRWSDAQIDEMRRSSGRTCPSVAPYSTSAAGPGRSRCGSPTPCPRT